MNRLYLIIIAFMIAIHGLAQLRYGRIVTINEPVWQDLYIAGGTVVVNAVVHGDLVVAGGTVQIMDSIIGDALVAGGRVSFGGPVGDDIRCAGGEIQVLNVVTGDLVSTGGSVLLHRDASAGSVIGAGGDIHIDGKVLGMVKVATGNLVINGSVGKGIDCRSEHITINGTVSGPVLMAASEGIKIGNQAAFNGPVRYWLAGNSDVDFRQALKGGAAIYDPSLRINFGRWYFLGFSTWAGLAWYLAMVLLMIMIVQYLFPVVLRRAGQIAWMTPLKALGYGVLFWIGIPVAAIIALLSVVAVPVGLLLVALYIISLFMATILTAVVGANWLNDRSTGHWGYWKLVFSGLLNFMILKVLTFSPFLGWLLLITTACMSVGAIVKSIPWRKKTRR